MDSLAYQYIYAKTGGGLGEYVPGQAPTTGVDHLTNQLASIRDAVTSSGCSDIRNQSALNYQYDAIGNLVGDAQSQITNISWSVYGKILSITDSGKTITYTYDAAGNRISKTANGITTWYVRDATGNVMSVYTIGDNSRNAGAVTQSEVDMYGSSRLGILNLNVNCTSLSPPFPLHNILVRGNKLFELTNHLGNVLVTISDKKLQHTPDSVSVDYFLPDVISATDYYSFGMPMPGRSFNNANYRYGFNGKENDNEVKGTGNSVDFGNRMDDTRGGRWFSTDKITKPWLSPYAFAANNPVNNIDADGKDEIHFHFYTNSVIGPDGKVMGGPTTARIEIIKANGPDRFFADMHSTVVRMPTNYSRGGDATSERTIEFYPWNPDSRSGLTKTTAAGIPFNDRDYATLIKYATASPALKDYIKQRSQGYEATANDKENYKGLLEDIPAYNTIAKLKQGFEIAASVVALLDVGVSVVTPSAASLPTRLVRVIPEEYSGSVTLGKPGDPDVFVTTPSDLKGLNTSDQIAQKLSLKDQQGNFVKGPFRLIEFDAPSEGLAQPYNRGNPGYINGGKTEGGATEYVVPNSKIGDLKNVTQRTVN